MSGLVPKKRVVKEVPLASTPNVVWVHYDDGSKGLRGLGDSEKIVSQGEPEAPKINPHDPDQMYDAWKSGMIEDVIKQQFGEQMSDEDLRRLKMYQLHK